MHKKNKTLSIMLPALFAAVISVLSILYIPMPTGVPFTLQTFAIALCGYVLGAKYGVISVCLYIGIGCAGIPVFSGMTGGIQKLFGYTGGFLYGFIIMVLFCGISKMVKNRMMSVLLGVMGLIICHLLAVVHFSLIMDQGFMVSAMQMSAPFLIKDGLSVIGAYLVSRPIIVRMKGMLNI